MRQLARLGTVELKTNHNRLHNTDEDKPHQLHVLYARNAEYWGYTQINSYYPNEYTQKNNTGNGNGVKLARTL